ncbi:MAG: cyclic pyranopterin monophosphate synthase MoaC [Pusillimonas sp.]|jgi:cyclic pyranopterin phosphate synthase|nr:cyclic pyranopterin monophosphate synthase MoaC [Pusillimonas sp.]
MSSQHDSGLTLSHLDEHGQIRMVDVGNKQATRRSATAHGVVRMSNRAFALLTAKDNAKGDVLNTARVAGILAAKRCAELIPLCHSLPLSFAGIDFELNESGHTITIRSTCRTDAQTGVEMEAMTACSVAALTIYDMCKAADKGIIIEQIRLTHKSGGKSGHWHSD